MRLIVLKRMFLPAVALVILSWSPPFSAAASPASDNVGSLMPDGSGPMPAAGLGIMVGELDVTSAIVQVRLTDPSATAPPIGSAVAEPMPGAAGVVRFDLHRPGQSESLQSQTAAAIEPRDYYARVKFDDLEPDTEYEVRTYLGSKPRQAKSGNAAPGPVATFKTLAGPGIATATHLAVVTGMNYAKFHGDPRIDRKQHLLENNIELPQSYQGDDKPLGYPALKSILKSKPQLFIGTGDNVYYDTPDNPRAETVAQMRAKWHQQFRQPRYIDLFANVPTMWEVDDHDYRLDDSDNSGLYRPLPEVGRAVLLEQLPYAIHERPAARTYRTRRINRDLQIWLTENRFYRDDNELPDTIDKSIWGRQQRDWLVETIAASDATFKVLVSPTPMIGPDDLRKTDNHCDIGGFRAERDWFFAELKERGLEDGFYIVCGDRHWQYHAIDPSGFEEFSCGALVDANSRLARMPGDPAGTDPRGLIRHLHTQTEPSGGFLNLYVSPGESRGSAELEMRFHDENGVVLYSVTKKR